MPDTGDCGHEFGLERTVSFALLSGHDVHMSGFEPWGPGDVFRSGLREIVAVRAALDALETELVVGARSRGYSWRELGKDLGLSAHGVRKRHLAVDPIYAWRSQRDPWLEAMSDKRESGG